jgi:hypothetical protein
MSRYSLQTVNCLPIPRRCMLFMVGELHELNFCPWRPSCEIRGSEGRRRRRNRRYDQVVPDTQIDSGGVPRLSDHATAVQCINVVSFMTVYVPQSDRLHAIAGCIDIYNYVEIDVSHEKCTMITSQTPYENSDAIEPIPSTQIVDPTF